MSIAEWRPYGDGTSGHQGDTSADSEPGRRARLGDALAAVTETGIYGLTWRDYARMRPGVHHGSASGALSNLHRSGLIVRLTERRNGAGIYVLPERVAGRTVVPYRRNRPPLATIEEGLHALAPLCRSELTGTWQIVDIDDGLLTLHYCPPDDTPPF